MTRQVSQIIATNGCGVLLLVMLAGGFLPAAAHAQVHVNVNIGAPPPVIVQAAPTMLFLPGPAMYVAVGVPYDIFFVDGRYYYFHGDDWFWAPGYGGPWVHIVHRSLPPGLRKHDVVQLREFREHEYRVYNVQGPKFKGKSFRAASGKHDDDDHDNDHDGGGHGKGNGRKHK